MAFLVISAIISLSTIMAPYGNQNTRGRGNGRGGSRGGRGGGRGGGRARVTPKLPAELRDKVDETYGKSGKKKEFKRRDDQASKPERTNYKQRDLAEAPVAGPSRIPASAPAPASKKVAVEDPPLKKKKKELRLPDARTDDAEDGEIQWLEYTLRNEKGKGKEEESDGLDGT